MRLAICDDSVLFAESLARLLVARGHSVVGLVNSPGQAAEVARQYRAEVWLTELVFAGRPDPEAPEALRQAGAGGRIMVLTSETDRALIQRALDAGAHGVALKTEGVGEVERLLRRLSGPTSASGGGTLGAEKAWSRLARALPDQRRPDPPGEELTAREQDVIRCVCQGLVTGEIAAELGLGSATVRSHLQHLYTKLDVHSRLGLVAYAARHGIVGGAETQTVPAA